MQNKRIKVLYIAAYGRSGSTILGQCLGQVPGFLFAGELRHIWEYNLLHNRLCGCGQAFRQCELWLDVFEHGFDGMNQTDPYEVVNMSRRFIRERQIGKVLSWQLQTSLGSSAPQLEQYKDVLSRLYCAIQSTTNCQVIVDSSKSPLYGAVLNLIDTIDLHVIHLVRDARGVANSWLKKRRLQQPGTEGPIFMQWNSPTRSALQWMYRNATIPACMRWASNGYSLIRYEDFVEHPEVLIRQIIGGMQQDTENLSFVRGNEVQLEPTHGVWGNPSRFNNGNVALRLDAEWQENLRIRDRFSVSALAWPLLKRYGYSFGP